MPEFDLKQKMKNNEVHKYGCKEAFFFAFSKNSQNSDFQVLSWSEECIKPVPVVWIHSSSLLQSSLMLQIQDNFWYSLSISGSSSWGISSE